MIYITRPDIDDICKLNKIVSLESCRDCKYCKELHKGIRTDGRNITSDFIRVQCDYESN